MSGQRRVVVLGGGVSGLTFTYYLNLFKNSVLTAKGAKLPQVTVLEKGSEVGGWMKSYKDPTTGAVFEYGPRSLRAAGYEAESSMALAEELGLASKVVPVPKKSPGGRNRMIYSKDRLHSLPAGVVSYFRKMSLINQSVLSLVMREARIPGSVVYKGKDESIHGFMSRRFGDDVADYLVDPFVRGIIAGDARLTSINAMFPRLKAAEDQYGSVCTNFSRIPEEKTGTVQDSALCRAARDQKWVMYNFEDGLGTLTGALHRAVLDQGAEVRTNTECTRLERNGDRFIVHTEGGKLEADLVIAAVNARTLAKLLASEHGSLSDQLSSLPIHDVATATLEYPSHITVPQAFGHLIPSGEDEDILGVIYDSVAFPQHDREDKSTKRLTAMIGGAWFEKVLGSNPSKSDVEEIAMRSIAKQLDITAEPVNIRANIIRNAIPQYPVGHPDIVAGIDSMIVEEDLPLTLIGPSFDYPGANSCIHKAKVQAKSILDQWDALDYKNTAVQSQSVE